MESGHGWALHKGAWQRELAHLTCDAIIGDPPYSARTHQGQSAIRAKLGYKPMDVAGVRELVFSWAPRCKGWMVFMTDDVLIPAYRAAYRAVGRLDFAPIPVKSHKPRLQGDGPACSAYYIMASRPRTREYSKWRSLPGWYEAAPVRGAGIVGAKPLGLLKALVDDYTKPGDKIIDPFAGRGTTAVAAVENLRTCITSEIDPQTFEKALVFLRTSINIDAVAALEAREQLQQEHDRLMASQCGDLFQQGGMQ
jgi:site-specific DNA-methyltransferase (adenine-specific)